MADGRERDDDQARSEAGRRLASLRRTRTAVCPICGESFTAVGRKVYCKETCRKRHWWRTNRGAETPAALPAELRQRHADAIV